MFPIRKIYGSEKEKIKISQGGGKMDSIRKINTVEKNIMERKKMQELQNKIIGHRNNIALTKGLPDIRKRQFIRKGILGIIAGIGIAVFSKMARAGSGFINFADGSTTEKGPLQSTVVSGSRTAASGTGTQTITGAGFAPKAAIIFAVEVDSAQLTSWGIGDDADGERVILHQNVTGGLDSTHNTSRIIYIRDLTDDMYAVLTSLDSDGCTLDWTKNGNGMKVDFHILFLR